jgi:hypothetical protein
VPVPLDSDELVEALAGGVVLAEAPELEALPSVPPHAFNKNVNATTVPQNVFFIMTGQALATKTTSATSRQSVREYSWQRTRATRRQKDTNSEFVVPPRPASHSPLREGIAASSGADRTKGGIVEP